MTTQERLDRLSENWIEIEEHPSGVWVLIDTRYDTSQPAFDSLEAAIKEGERTLNLTDK